MKVVSLSSLPGFFKSGLFSCLCRHTALCELAQDELPAVP